LCAVCKTYGIDLILVSILDTATHPIGDEIID
jgi:hypothetical protein